MSVSVSVWSHTANTSKHTFSKSTNEKFFSSVLNHQVFSLIQPETLLQSSSALADRHVLLSLLKVPRRAKFSAAAHWGIADISTQARHRWATKSIGAAYFCSALARARTLNHSGRVWRPDFLFFFWLIITRWRNTAMLGLYWKLNTLSIWRREWDNCEGGWTGSGREVQCVRQTHCKSSL